MDKQAEIERIKQKYAERNKEIERQHRKEMARIIGGGVLQGASALPIFNIPYVGTGLGGALFDAGNAIMQGKNAKDIAKDAGKGFVVGETVGAIPYVGKAVNKSFLKTLRKTKMGIKPLEKTHQERFADDLMGSDDVLDLTGIFDKKAKPEEVKEYIMGLTEEGAMETKSPEFLIDVRNVPRVKKHLQYPTGYNQMSRTQRNRHNSLALKLKEIINNSKHTGYSKNTKIEQKPNVEGYHYFNVNTKVGENETLPIILDAEQLVGESTQKPQTVHLYNFKEKR
jgi:hypothetical protein